MTTSFTLAFEQLFGPQDWNQPREWDGAPVHDEPDLYVSDDEARYLQRRYDDWLERESA